MNWQILAVSRPKLEYAQSGIGEYLQRLTRFARVETRYVKDEAALLAGSAGAYRLVLDGRGQQWSSQEVAQQLREWELRSVKTIAVLIGGPDGHGAALREKADQIWSLGRLTLPHELALVVLLEQVYRAYSIKAGLPYHRD